MRSGRRRAQRERSSGLVLAGVLVVLAAAAGAEALAGVGRPPDPAPVPQLPAEAGMWFCPATAGAQEEVVLSVASVSEEPSTVTVLRYPEGEPVADPPVFMSPGDELDLVLPPGHGVAPLAVRWEGGPTVASWRVEGPDSAGAPCEPSPASHWYIVGLDTDGRSRSIVHLFNPFAVDAVARVTFGTPGGRVTLVRTDNVVVPAGRPLRLELETLQPQQPDLGVAVEVLTGRLVAAGEVFFEPRPDEPGARGRALLAAVRGPQLAWANGYARQDENASSWLMIMNPSEREALVELQVSDPFAGGITFTDLAVPGGATARVDLAEASEAFEFGVALTVANDVPVVVSRLTSLRSADGRLGVAASHASEPSTEWALAGAGGGARRSRLAVYNPGTAAVNVDVLLGGIPAPGWEALSLTPNEWALLDVSAAIGDRPSVPLRIRATGVVVTELQSHAAGEQLRYWTAPGLPKRTWAGPATRPPVRRDRSLPTTPAQRP